jgi:hypothetical protein
MKFQLFFVNNINMGFEQNSLKKDPQYSNSVDT